MEQKEVQGGADRVHGTVLSRKGLMAPQAKIRTASHGRVAGGRSHGGKGLHTTLVTIGGNRADGSGALGADRERKEQSDADGPLVHNGATATTPHKICGFLSHKIQYFFRSIIYYYIIGYKFINPVLPFIYYYFFFRFPVFKYAFFGCSACKQYKILFIMSHVK